MTGDGGGGGGGGTFCPITAENIISINKNHCDQKQRGPPRISAVSKS